MSNSYAKPDNALQKAIDLVNVGKPAAAMDVLRAAIAPKRHRPWHPSHEQIMIMNIGLAVKSRRNIKDMLIQYRSLCQSGQHASLQRVMAAYLEEVIKRTDAVQAEVTSSGASDVSVILADLEESPTTILAALELKDGLHEERKGRAQLTLWVKYTWETCRTILDVLRNNDACQAFYHRVAIQTFTFCQTYRRTTEFRRLCEILRNHVNTISRHQGQTNAVSLNSPETQEMYLKTRFEQLRIAADLELWQEASRTIEDIHTSMILSAAAPPITLMRTLFEKLSQIFWASNNYLFHAYSLNKFYKLTAGCPSTPEERTELANAVVLAALVVPMSAASNSEEDYFDPDNENNRRLADLLDFSDEIPTRRRLLVDIKNVVLTTSENVRAAVGLLESGFAPLSLNRKLNPILASFEENKNLSKYSNALRKSATLVLLNQLSTVYKTMKAERFMRLVPTGITMSELEAIVIQSNFDGITQIRFDHRKQLIHFSENDLTFGKVPAQLATLGRKLQEIVVAVEPVDMGEKMKEREAVFRMIAEGMEEEHKAVFHRMKMIEQRKQFNEKHREVELQEAQREKAMEEAKRAEEERKRLAQERKKREEDRQRKTDEAQRKRDLEQLAKRLQADMEGKGAARKTTNEISQALSNLENVKTEELRQLQQKVEEEARNRKEEARRQQSTHLDFLTRALRLEEKELLVKQAQEQMELDQESLEKEYENELKRAKARHDQAREDCKRLGRMRANRDLFLARTNARRTQSHEKQMEQWRKRKAQEEQARLEREEQERQARIARQEEEERLRKEREVQRQEAERRAKQKAEEKAKREEEEAARQAKLAELAEKQKRREEEIAERDRKAREGSSAQSTETQKGAYRPPGSRREVSTEDGGGWRSASNTGRFGRDDGPRRDSRFGRGNDRDNRFGGRDDGPRDNRFGGRGGDRDSRFGGRDDGPRDSRFGGRDDGPRDSRFGGRGGSDRDSRFGGRDDGPRDSRFGGRGGSDRDSRFGGRDDGPRDSRFGGRGGSDRDSRFGGRDDGPRDSRFGGRGGSDRDSRFGGRDNGPRDNRFGGRGGDRNDDRDSGPSGGAYRPPQRDGGGDGNTWRRSGGGNDRDSGRPGAYRPPMRGQRDSQSGGDRDSDRDSGRPGAYRPPMRGQRDSQSGGGGGGGGGWRRNNDGPSNRRDNDDAPPRRDNRDRDRQRNEKPVADDDGFTAVQGRRR